MIPCIRQAAYSKRWKDKKYKNTGECRFKTFKNQKRIKQNKYVSFYLVYLIWMLGKCPKFIRVTVQYFVPNKQKI